MRQIKKYIYAAFLLPQAAIVFAQSQDIRPAHEAVPNLFESEMPEDAVFERPLRQNRINLPARIIRQQSDRTRFPVIPHIQGLDRALTESYIKKYSSPSGLIWLSGVMKKSEPYLPFIREEIEKRGLPRDLLYLPVVESGFVVTAKSSSGATGLWQFMYNSIKPHMVVNEWVDERKDFWKSTHAALSKLESNHKLYQDWPLSLAAYNSGAGAVSKIVKQTGTNDYWVLSDKKHLKPESVQYVPKLLAISYIVSNPRKFGLDISWKPKKFEWTRLAVDRQINIETLAEYAGIEKNELYSHNRELNHGVTPPGSYSLKVRKPFAEAVQQTLNRDDIQWTTTVVLPAPFTGTWTVKKGDTLWSIARAHNTSAALLAQANGMAPGDILSIGKTLKVPK